MSQTSAAPARQLLTGTVQLGRERQAQRAQDARDYADTKAGRRANSNRVPGLG
ncbi:hypothetical protein [Streptomyces hebeiensis]